jgi:hypothetical protein
MRVAELYLREFGNIAKEGNTVLLPADAGNPAAMVANAMAAMGAVHALGPARNRPDGGGGEEGGGGGGEAGRRRRAAPSAEGGAAAGDLDLRAAARKALEAEASGALSASSASGASSFGGEARGGGAMIGGGRARLSTDER